MASRSCGEDLLGTSNIDDLHYNEDESNLRIHPTFFLESRQKGKNSLLERTLEISIHHSPSDVAMSRNLPAATLLNQKGFNLSSVEREYSKMIASQTSNVTTKQLECMASSKK